MEPALAVVLLRAARVAELVGRVIGVQEVLDDCAGLPDGEAGVGVLDGGHAAVGVDGDEGLLLHDREVEKLTVVWDAQLFHDDGNLPWVGTL